MVRKEPDQPEQGDPFEEVIKAQNVQLDQYYIGAPVLKPESTKLRGWRDLVPLTAAEYKSLTKEDKDRLNYWYDAWTTPVANYTNGENTAAQRVFFGIMKDKTGLDRADFNWTKFRRRYFRAHPDKYAAFKEHQKSRKGKKK